MGVPGFIPPLSSSLDEISSFGFKSSLGIINSGLRTHARIWVAPLIAVSRPFKDWSKSLPGYPITPKGQAFWITDFIAGMRDRSDVVGIYIFGPEFWFSGEVWSPFALFDEEGRARPAVASFGEDG